MKKIEYLVGKCDNLFLAENLQSMSNPNPDTSGLIPFQPGQSGNPAGPKPGTKHLSTWIQELLNDEEFTATIREGLQIKEYKGAPIKAIVATQLRMAINGDQKAFDLLGKYGYGTKQTIEHEGSLVVGTPDPDKAKKFAEFLKDDTKDS